MMPTMEFSRKLVETYKSEYYTLSIRINADGFCFCIQDELLRIIFFRNVASSAPYDFSHIGFLETIIGFEPFFNYSFRKIIITLDTRDFSLIPIDLYEEKQSRETFAFVNITAETKKNSVKADIISSNGIVNLYVHPNIVCEFLRQKFPQAIIQHQASRLIKDVISSSQLLQDGTPLLHVDVHSTHFYATIAEKGRLIMANVFRYKTVDEFVYFITSLVNCFLVNNNKTSITFSGDIKKGSNEIRLLKKYIPQHITFSDCSAYLSGAISLQDIEPHQLSKLLQSCE